MSCLSNISNIDEGQRQDVDSASAGARKSPPSFPAPDSSSGSHNGKTLPGSVDHAACMQPRRQESAPHPPPPKPQGGMRVPSGRAYRLIQPWHPYPPPPRACGQRGARAT